MAVKQNANLRIRNVRADAQTKDVYECDICGEEVDESADILRKCRFCKQDVCEDG